MAPEWIKRLQRQYGHETLCGRVVIMLAVAAIVAVAFYWLVNLPAK